MPFIRPTSVAELNSAAISWEPKAGNLFFALEQRKGNIGSKFLSTFAALGASLAASADTLQKLKWAEAEYRIVLKCKGRKYGDQVVAVGDTFDRIHESWNWIEQNLYLKLAELETSMSTGGRRAYTDDDVATFLIKQFEELAEQLSSSLEPRINSTISRLSERRSQLIHLFPGLEDEVLLNFFTCNYLENEASSVRGILYITRNYVCFHGVRGDTTDSAALHVRLRIPYKDISIKEINYLFSLYFYRKDCLRTISCLCDASMNYLIKGAEVSLSATADMFAKGGQNVSGDLANNMSGRKGGGLLMMGRSQGEFGLSRNRLARTIKMDLEEGDFTEQSLRGTPVRASPFAQANSGIETAFVSAPASPSNDYALNSSKQSNATEKVQSTKATDTDTSAFLYYAHVNLSSIRSLEDLDMQKRNIEFRRVFRLSYSETVLIEEAPCALWRKATATSHSGVVFVSPNYFCFGAFASTPGGSNAVAPLSSVLNVSGPASGTSVASNTTVSSGLTSILFESQELTMSLVIPLREITNVKKQPPTALPSAGRITAFSLSGYLAVSTRNRGDYWYSFGSAKGRDRATEVLLARLRNVDWHMDNSTVGSRSAQESAAALAAKLAERVDGASSPVALIGGDGTLSRRASGASTGSLDEYRFNLSASSMSSNDLPKSLTHPTVQVGLKYLFEEDLDSLPALRKGHPSYYEFHDMTDQEARQGTADDRERRKKEVTEHIKIWNDHLDVNGRDVCFIKDVKVLREFLIKTDGIPEKIRGDLWLVLSGAWYSKHEPMQYMKILTDHQGLASPFAEEIEKDVRRSLPEHPAYQSSVGIDALRRLLTAYSWRNPSIGYAQALNIISSVLLLHLKEEDAFRILCIVIERILPDHYTRTLVGSVVDQSVFSHLVSLHLPLLQAHLKKLYMDCSIFSVPWFMCLFLNTVPLKAGFKILDGFFLDGPSFIFWVALAVLKINERRLLAKGRDDDLFVGVLKDYFGRLAVDAPPDNESDNASFMTRSSYERGSSESPEKTDAAQDPSLLWGRPLLTTTLNIAYSQFAAVVNMDVIDSLRIRYRLSVVHQMEDASRKSQIRTLCEQVGLSFDEIAIVYDEVRSLEFDREEEGNGLVVGAAGTAAALSLLEEEHIRLMLIKEGGWAMVKNASDATPEKVKTLEKSIPLRDFRKVFGKMSPWSSGGNIKSVAPANRAAEDPLQLALSRSEGRDQAAVGTLSQPTNEEDNPMSPNGNTTVAYIVDLAAVIHILDIMMRQPLSNRLKFLFDIHDLDGDGYLSKHELKAIMDSFLEMFEKNRSSCGNTSPTSQSTWASESNSRGVDAATSLSPNGPMTGLGTMTSPVSGTANAMDTPILSIAKGGRRTRSASVIKPILVAEPEEDEAGDMTSLGGSINGNRGDAGMAESEISSPLGSGTSSSTAPFPREKQRSQQPGHSRTLSASGVGSKQSSRTSSERVRSETPPPNNGSNNGPFKLSFNEFLLAVLSQSIFVAFFEKTWTLKKEASDSGVGGCDMGRIVLESGS
ncbi:hypothetical protein SeMB42_g03311 [Synchytrium endobioticum]|uniref:Rab-GAP TBC domain-containing protein n=1 Tax=Synchytrium endobioticum TaxID=286115 RepID=A0A507D7X0_9FUNG|nr:hypothetical protein SeMB42_g03311 [Synchytrium endobioticum]